jgi:hypothetical protein
MLKEWEKRDKERKKKRINGYGTITSFFYLISSKIIYFLNVEVKEEERYTRMNEEIKFETHSSYFQNSRFFIAQKKGNGSNKIDEIGNHQEGIRRGNENINRKFNRSSERRN